MAAATIATTERLIEEKPKAAAGAIRAIVVTLAALRADFSLATKVGRKLFPPLQAKLIAELIRRDLPFYDPRLSRDFIGSPNRFCTDMGALAAEVAYEQVVSTQFSHLWNSA